MKLVNLRLCRRLLWSRSPAEAAENRSVHPHVTDGVSPEEVRRSEETSRLYRVSGAGRDWSHPLAHVKLTFFFLSWGSDLWTLCCWRLVKSYGVPSLIGVKSFFFRLWPSLWIIFLFAWWAALNATSAHCWSQSLQLCDWMVVGEVVLDFFSFYVHTFFFFIIFWDDSISWH